MMTQEEKYRQQAKIFLGKIKEARAFFGNHKPSIGFVGEYILRNSLKALMPHSYGICQGFVTHNGNISKQCDIIIYTKGKDDIRKSYGELENVNAESVVSVIEVKSSLSKKTFHTTIKAFELLEQFGITNSSIFIYDKLTYRSLKRWLFEYKYPSANADKNIVADTYLYDWPDKEWLPNSIVALESNKYFKLNHLSAYDGDWIGYSALNIKDHSNAQISCLQEFFSDILMAINGEVIPVDIEKYSIDNGVVLFRI
jgi:hypothetical protein